MYGFLRHQQSKQLAKPLSWHFRQAGLKKPEVSAKNFQAQEYETFMELLNAHTIVDEKALIDSALQAGVKGRSAKALANYCSVYQKDLLNSMDKSLDESYKRSSIELSREDLSSEIKVLQDRMNILLKRQKALITEPEDVQSKIIKTQEIPVQEELFAKSRENAIHDIGTDDNKDDTSEVVDKKMKCIPTFGKKEIDHLKPKMKFSSFVKECFSDYTKLDKVREKYEFDAGFHSFDGNDARALIDILLMCRVLGFLTLNFWNVEWEEGKVHIMGKKEVLPLAKHLSQLKRFWALEIDFARSFQAIDGAGLITILRAVKAEQMKHLWLRNFDITPVLADLLKLRNLKYLALCNSGLKTGNSTMLSFAGGLSRMKILQELILHTNSFGYAEVKILAGVLPELMNLKKLNLNRNNIRCPGIKILARALAGLKYLKWIELKFNKIESPGLKMLAGVLPEFKSLETLYVDHNRICDGGAEVLVGVLPKLKKFKCLHIRHGNLLIDMFHALHCKRGDYCIY